MTDPRVESENASESGRGISTVVDAVLFLLLVSTAVVTVTLPGEGPGAPGADESAQLLATTTASVEYQLGSAPAGEPTRTRNAHGTLAELAARAAIADATVAGRPLSPAGEHFVQRVREQIQRRIGPRTQIHARWRPYESSSIYGAVKIGAQPPPATDVTASVLRVPVGASAGPTGLPADYGDVAGVVAERLSARLLPATSAEVPRVDGPVSRDIRRRYRLLAGDRAARVTELFEAGNVSAATTLTRETLTDQVRADLRREFESPAVAARRVETGTVIVTVRRWGR